jgi:hypothetical protein
MAKPFRYYGTWHSETLISFIVLPILVTKFDYIFLFGGSRPKTTVWKGSHSCWVWMWRSQGWVGWTCVGGRMDVSGWMDGRTVTFCFAAPSAAGVGCGALHFARIETKICRGDDSSSQYCRRSMSGRKQGLYWYAGLQFSVKFLQSTSSLARSLAPSVVVRGLLSVSVSGGELGFFLVEEEDRGGGGGGGGGVWGWFEDGFVF